MTKPLLHSKTSAQLDAILTDPPHALLLSGAPGIGKATVSDWLAEQVLGLATGGLTNYPYVLQLRPEAGKAIGIEAVRELEHFLTLRTTGTHNIARLVIIYDAHRLTAEAQNALLKTLEEPPAGTMLLLTGSQLDALLPTIRSRVQMLEIIRPPSAALTTALQARGVATVTINRILALSGGLPGLAMALASDDQSHPLVAATQTARELLQQSAFEKLCHVDRLSKDKEASRNVLYILSQMAHAALLTGGQGERWQKVLAASYQASVSLDSGAQTKLVLTNLMLQL